MEMTLMGQARIRVGSVEATWRWLWVGTAPIRLHVPLIVNRCQSWHQMVVAGGSFTARRPGPGPNAAQYQTQQTVSLEPDEQGASSLPAAFQQLAKRSLQWCPLQKKGVHSGRFFNFQVSRISNREQEPGDFQLPLPLQHPYFCLQVYKTGNGTVGDENLNSHPHFQWIPEPFKILLVREPLSGVSVCKYLFTHEIASDQTRWIF